MSLCIILNKRHSVFIGAEEKINPQTARDIPWAEAARVKALRPHGNIKMLILSDKGPVKSWICPKCNLTENSVTAQAPICYGGMRNRARD